MSGGQPTAETPSLQTRFDQIGNQIDEAHKVLDRICVEGSEDKTLEPAQEGAEPGAASCSRSISRLLERLNNVADRVGHL